MRLETIKHQGQASCQYGTKSKSAELLAENSSDSARTIQRYIRLTNLKPPLLEMVDNQRIAFNPAVELSYLAGKEQDDLLEIIQREDCTPSLSQAIHLKKLSQEGNLDIDAVSSILCESNGKQTSKLTIQYSAVQKYYPATATPLEIETDLVKLLEERQRRRERNKSQER